MTERGKDLHIADTLSRAYSPTAKHSDAEEFERINITSFLPVSNSRLHEIQRATNDDETLKQLKIVILEGWPEERSKVPAQITPYYSYIDELTIQDGIVFRGQRIVIPSSLRQDMK